MGSVLPSLSGALCDLDAVSKIADGGKEGHQRRVRQLKDSNVFFFCGEGGGGQHGYNSGTPSGNIMVLVSRLLVPFHVVSVYKRLDPLLQIARLWKGKQFRC